MEFSDDERTTLLLGVYELMITRSALEGPEQAALVERIDDLGRKLGGDPDAPLFGAEHRG